MTLTRQYFSDTKQLKKIALIRSKTFDGQLFRWWENKYKPHAFVSFEKRTRGSLLAEYYFDAAVELENLKSQKEESDLDFETRQQIENKINKLNRIFYDEKEIDKLQEIEDPLIAKWEKQLEMGLDPDLDE